MKKKQKVTGYDKYVDWKIFSIPVVLFFVVLLIPTPYGMKDVGMEYTVASDVVIEHFTKTLFGKSASDAAQWEMGAARMMEQSMRIGALNRDRFLKRNLKWCKQYKIDLDAKNFKRVMTHIESEVPDHQFLALMEDGINLRKTGLTYESLSDKQRQLADKGAWQIKVAVAMGLFVVLCFLTECIPLPAVAFCIGLILVFTGVVTRQEVV